MKSRVVRMVAAVRNNPKKTVFGIGVAGVVGRFVQRREADKVASHQQPMGRARWTDGGIAGAAEAVLRSGGGGGTAGGRSRVAPPSYHRPPQRMGRRRVCSGFPLRRTPFCQKPIGNSTFGIAESQKFSPTRLLDASKLHRSRGGNVMVQKTSLRNNTYPTIFIRFW